MTEAIDLLIQTRFDAVANLADDGDWNDVLARARSAEPVDRTRSGPPLAYLRRRFTRVALIAAVVALALVVTAVAFGWPRTIIDFFTSPPAPRAIKNAIGIDNVGAPKGMNPRAIPGETRRIMTARFDDSGRHPDHPALHTLYVAPTRNGGFCYEWTNADGGCASAKNPETNAGLRATGPLGVTWSVTNGGYPLLVDGWVRTGATKTIEARFADGTTTTLPINWVSAPINAGFFVYPVPEEHQTRANALGSVVALDASGRVVGRQTFPLTKALDEDVMQTLPDGTKYSLPRSAIAARARKIISFRTTTGSRAYVWVMPRRGGGLCFLSNRMDGCPSAYWLARSPVFNGGVSGSTNPPLLFSGRAKPEVARIELRYQNGEREWLTPIDGFVLTEIKPTHYARDKRLVAAVAFDRRGTAIFTQRYEPNTGGIYPCKKPTNRGYGLKMCP